jgi:hypothetical protein
MNWTMAAVIRVLSLIQIEILPITSVEEITNCSDYCGISPHLLPGQAKADCIRAQSVTRRNAVHAAFQEILCPLQPPNDTCSGEAA